LLTLPFGKYNDSSAGKRRNQMAALAFRNSIQTIDYIRLDTSTAESDKDNAFLLEATRLQTGAQTAVVYARQGAEFELKGIAARSSIASRVKDAAVTIDAEMSERIESLPGPVQGSPIDARFFERFPEVFQYHLKRLAVVPLRAGKLLGLLTLGRSEETSFNASDLETAQRAARLLAALRERDSLQQDLLDRKLVERASRILQRRRRLSEERAYRLMRDISRRRRISVPNLAKEIVEITLQRQLLRNCPMG
jgi:GAF domain-containing protein